MVALDITIPLFFVFIAVVFRVRIASEMLGIICHYNIKIKYLHRTVPRLNSVCLKREVLFLILQSNFKVLFSSVPNYYLQRFKLLRSEFLLIISSFSDFEAKHSRCSRSEAVGSQVKMVSDIINFTGNRVRTFKDRLN